MTEAQMQIPSALQRALVTLLNEVVDGPPGREAFVLNPEDKGLLGSIEALSAADASQVGQNGSSIAAHVDHLRYGLSLMNRWAAGDNAFGNADWKASWRRMSVTDAEWDVRRRELREEATRWRDTVFTRSEADEAELTGIISSVVHMAYHLGAIRQIQPLLRGPRA
jgi:hypothetical protein